MKPFNTLLTLLAALPAVWTTPTPEDKAAELTKRDIFALHALLPRDPSGKGVTHLSSSGVLSTLNSKREVLGSITLTREEMASLPVPAIRSPGSSKRKVADHSTGGLLLEERACIDYACDEDEDCNAECPHGCWYQDPPGRYRCM